MATSCPSKPGPCWPRWGRKLVVHCLVKSLSRSLWLRLCFHFRIRHHKRVHFNKDSAGFKVVQWNRNREESGGVHLVHCLAFRCSFVGSGVGLLIAFLCMEGRQLTKSANFSTNRLRRMRTYVRTGTYFLLPGLPRSLCHIVSALEGRLWAESAGECLWRCWSKTEEMDRPQALQAR